MADGIEEKIYHSLLPEGVNEKASISITLSPLVIVRKEAGVKVPES